MSFTKEKSKQERNKKIEVWLLKASIIFFFVAITIGSFFFFGGLKIFQPTIFVNDFRGCEFQIHTIDVENGDAFLLRLPNNKTMLIDCGEEEYSNRVVSYINQYFESEGLNKIDYFIITHPDSDHCGAGEIIFDNFKVDRLYRPTINSMNEPLDSTLQQSFKTSESTIYDDVIMAAIKQKTKMIYSQEGEKINLDNCEIQFLSPSKTSYENDNNYSAVIKIRYYTKSFLFMGDAEQLIEKTLIEKYGSELKADLLKVGHHGSKTSTSQEFLSVVAPEYAIISAGDNSSMHPNKEVVERIKLANCEILSTAEKQNFVLTVNYNQIVFESQKESANVWAIVFSMTIVLCLVVLNLPFSPREKQKNSKPDKFNCE